MIYGVVADLLVFIPPTCYVWVGGLHLFNAYHETMIMMMTFTWMPFAISWLLVNFADKPFNRRILSGALTTAEFGVFAFMWIGLMSFIMSVTSAGTLGEVANIIFLFTYLLGNVGLVAMHWILSGDIKKWIKYAPYEDLRTVAKIESKKGKKGAKSDKKAKEDVVDENIAEDEKVEASETAPTED